MLASDLNNPEFANPTNPDAMLHVEFFWAQPVNKWASDVAGKEVLGERRPFVRIMRPGDNTSIIETADRVSPPVASSTLSGGAKTESNGASFG